MAKFRFLGRVAEPIKRRVPPVLEGFPALEFGARVRGGDYACALGGEDEVVVEREVGGGHGERCAVRDECCARDPSKLGVMTGARCDPSGVGR
jgi:hypothetical protein